MRLHLGFGIGRGGSEFGELQERARMIESLGYNGIWSGHHLPVPGDTARTTTDPLMALLIAASATTKVELGTNIYCLALVNAGNFAQSVYTLEAIAGKRFSFGVGTGSSKQEWDISGLNWDDRFKVLENKLSYVRSIFSGVSDIKPEELTFGDDNRKYEQQRAPQAGEPTLAMRLGPPKFLLGTWRSPTQLKRAATRYDGWLGSAGPGALFGGWRKVFTESMKIFRDNGGTRALLTTTLIDPFAAPKPLTDEGVFDLIGSAEEITERLHLLEEIGFNDVIVSPWDHANMTGRPLTRELAEHIRSLIPIDATPPWAD